MALPLGKLSIIVGAGIVGSILAKEGRMSGVSDFVSGAFKIAFRQLKHDDSTLSNKPRNDYLMAQVNSLRQELQILASNRPITIVTGQGTGTSKYSIIVVVVVVGYGYVWWKGWRLPNMMFATRRSLSDARDAIAKQLESATKRQLSSRIEGVDNRLHEIADITATTHEEVTLLQDQSKKLNTNVQSVRYVVQTLESKIKRIEGKQDMTNEGVNWLCDYAQTIEQNRPTDHTQALPANSSRPALEAPTKTPSRSGSLPPILPVEPPSPSSGSSNGTPKVQRSPRHVISSSGLKELGESSANNVGNNGTVFSGLSGLFSVLTRTRSATNAPMGGGSSGQQ
ncbi:ATP-dependent helicase/deoxyribonuclease subunit B [Gossypium australe]|uniref:ATP-dependent helicase/deoxyribonuclease subunit B n=1 Tax=Gossypium australe TaxID=47621 RepID=A0A5B6V2M1_9ROSI|nr:ATP-dependent helicase/deoxyribonuclease subunit B [Gossypium australe]